MEKHFYNLKKDIYDERDYMFKTVNLSLDSIPNEVDLRALMPPIYNQGNLGSCTANAGCANRIYLLKNNDIELSRLYLYYKERELEGNITEDSGASMRSICKALNKNGVCEEKFFPYDISKFINQPSKEADENAINYEITKYHRITSIDEIKRCIALGMPVLIGIKLFESFESEYTAKTGKVVMPNSSEKLLGGHAVLCVGYHDNEKPTLFQFLLGLFSKQNQVSSGYFIVRNSWGTEWGDKGYFYLPYEYLKHVLDVWVIGL